MREFRTEDFDVDVAERVVRHRPTGAEVRLGPPLLDPTPGDTPDCVVHPPEGALDFEVQELVRVGVPAFLAAGGNP